MKAVSDFSIIVFLIINFIIKCLSFEFLSDIILPNCLVLNL